MKLGLFSDVAVEREGSRDAPVLVYRVVERPALREWRVEGNEELSKKDLEEIVALKAGQLVDPAAVQKDVKKIQEKYVEKGFYLAEVASRLEERPDNQVDVVFVVNEQAKVEVKEVRFIGNAHVPAGDLRGIDADARGRPALVPLRRGHLPRGGAPARPAGDPGALPRPRLRHREGGDARRSRSPPTGASSTSPSRSRRASSTRSGRSGSRGSSSTRSRGSASSSGRGRARPSPAPTSRRTSSRSATSTRTSATPTRTSPRSPPPTRTSGSSTSPSRCSPGKMVTFERIEIVGNEKTRDKVIRRELRVYEGERFSGTGLRQSRQRVNALGFFESAEITTKPGSTDDKIVATDRGEGAADRHLPDRRRLLLVRELHPHRADLPAELLRLGPDPLAAAPVVEDPPARADPVRRAVLPRHALDVRLRPLHDGGHLHDLHAPLGRRLAHLGLRALRPRRAGGRSRERLEDMRVFATYTNERVDVTAAEATHDRAQPVHLGHDELGPALAPVGQARQPAHPDEGVLPRALGRGGAAGARAERALRQPREPVHPVLLRRPRLLPALAGPRRAREADARPHPRLGRGAPGAHLRALLRRRDQLGPRLPVPLDRAAGVRAWRRPEARTRRRATWRSAATSRRSSTSSWSSRSSARRGSGASSSPTSATRSRRGSTPTRRSRSRFTSPSGSGFAGSARSARSGSSGGSRSTVARIR